MSALKVQRDVNAIHHEYTCRRLVELVSQEVVDVRGVKKVLREAIAMMKVMTKLHVQFVQGGSLTSDDSSQWMQAIKDRHNVAKPKVG